MYVISPMSDVSAAGCLANATLCTRDKPKTEAEVVPFAAAPRAAVAPAPAKPKQRWRRLAEALMSLISGSSRPNCA